MTNADPKNEIYNCPAPINWIVVTPNSNSRGNRINKTHASEAATHKASMKHTCHHVGVFALRLQILLLADPNDFFVFNQRRVDPRGWFDLFRIVN